MSEVPESAVNELGRELRSALRRELRAVEGTARLLLQKLEREAAPRSTSGELLYARRILARLGGIEHLADEVELPARLSRMELRPLALGEWIFLALEDARGALAPELREDLGFTLDIAEKDSRIGGEPLLLR